jgi:AAA-like domain
MLPTPSFLPQTPPTVSDRPPKTMIHQRRKRGYVLTSRGWQHLQTIIQAVAQRDHQDVAYTLHELSELTGLSPNTLTRVRSCKIPVDRQTLEIFFQTFGLTLTVEDYTQLDVGLLDSWGYVLQGGQLPLYSPLYVCRPPLEAACAQALLQPGGLVHIRAPKQMGKTSLAARTLADLREQGFSTVLASLQLADATVFTEGKRFFQWFCAVVAGSLGLPNQIEQYWDDHWGNSYNCTRYFEEYVLPAAPLLVVALDEMDAIFTHPAIATDFLNMVRAWYEKARYADQMSELWQKLRLMLIYALDVELLPYLHSNHFNAGFVTEIPRLTVNQVRELAQVYQLECPLDCAHTLIDLVGGHPYLTQLGLYHLKQSDRSLDQFLRLPLLMEGLYSQHLRCRLWDLQQHADLLVALKQVVQSPLPVDLSPMSAFKLQSLGLVQLQGQQVAPSCNLYRQYFQQMLALV